MYGKGLRPLSIATVVMWAVTLSLVFFYAPIEADQGFLQKIFYLHVPLAITSLCGFVIGGIFALLPPRPAPGRLLLRRYPRLGDHGGRRPAHRGDLGEGLVGPLVSLERTDPGQL